MKLIRSILLVGLTFSFSQLNGLPRFSELTIGQSTPWVATTALKCTSYTPYLEATSGSVFSPEYNQAWSASILFYADSLAIQSQIFSKTKTGSPYSGQVLYVKTSGAIGFEFASTQGSNWLRVTTSGTPISTGNWYRITVTLDGSATAAGVHIYVNSSSQALTVNNNSLSATVINTTPFRLYREPRDTGVYVNGRLKDFAWWNVELSGSQVTSLGSVSTDLFSQSSAASLQNFWRMETGIIPADTSSIVYDRKGSDNLTGSGFTAGSYVAYP